jgi:hypothetical protein
MDQTLTNLPLLTYLIWLVLILLIYLIILIKDQRRESRRLLLIQAELEALLNYLAISLKDPNLNKLAKRLNLRVAVLEDNDDELNSQDHKVNNQIKTS